MKKFILVIAAVITSMAVQAQITISVNKDNGDLFKKDNTVITETGVTGNKWISNINSGLDGASILSFSKNEAVNCMSYVNDSGTIFKFYNSTTPYFIISAPEGYKIIEYKFDAMGTNANGPSYLSLDNRICGSGSAYHDYVIPKSSYSTISHSLISNTAEFSTFGSLKIKDFTITLRRTKEADISFSSSTGIIYANGKKDLPKFNNPYCVKVSYSNSDPSVALIDENTGNLSPITFGSTTITASWEEQIIDGTIFLSGSASYTLIVSALTPENNPDSDPTLTIKQADNGTISTKVPTGTAYTFTIAANEGWLVHSVTFNEEDVTSQLNDSKEFTTPAITENSTLCVVYEEDVPSAIPSIEDSSMKIKGTAYGARVTNANIGDIIQIYSKDGVLRKSVKVKSQTIDIPLEKDEVYIIKAGEKTLKLRH